MSDRHRDAWTKFVQDREAQPAPAGRVTAQGRTRLRTMNKTEAAYEAHLNLRKITGEVLWFQFEGITLKLADDTRLTIDFPLMLADGTLELHDVKGTERRVKKNGEPYAGARVEDDAKVKMAVAAAMFPFVFKTVYKLDGNWIEREY